MLTRYNPGTKLVKETLVQIMHESEDSYETGIGRGHTGF